MLDLDPGVHVSSRQTTTDMHTDRTYIGVVSESRRETGR